MADMEATVVVVMATSNTGTVATNNLATNNLATSNTGTVATNSLATNNLAKVA